MFQHELFQQRYQAQRNDGRGHRGEQADIIFFKDPSVLKTIEKMSLEGIIWPLGMDLRSTSRGPKHSIDLRESSSPPGLFQAAKSSAHLGCRRTCRKQSGPPALIWCLWIVFGILSKSCSLQN